MDVLISRITKYLIDQEIIPAQEEELMIYGLDMVIYTVLSLTSLLIMGALVGHLVTAAVLLCGFCPMQMLGGGYHAQTHLRCFLTMAIGLGISILAVSYLPAWSLMLMGGFGVCFIFLLAPHENPNAPMSDEKKRRMRRYVRIFACIYFALSCILWAMHISFSPIMALAVFCSGISMCSAKLIARR